jgi:hypothetical protein
MRLADAMVVCILLANRVMPPTLRRPLVLSIIAAVLAVAAPAAAQESWQSPPHVRPDAELRSLFDEATGRSPTVRGLVNWLETLDVTVYVRASGFLPTGLEGRAALLSAQGGHRYIVIDLAAGRTAIMQISTLGHELFHAVEIARDPSIVDARSLKAFYVRNGIESGGNTERRQTFETPEAAATGRRVRHELLAGTTRNSDGT